MVQALFGLNERYWITEKGAVEVAETFLLSPENWAPGWDAAWERSVPGPRACGEACRSSDSCSTTRSGWSMVMTRSESPVLFQQQVIEWVCELCERDTGLSS
jgi:hypothetical protein